MSIRNPFRPSFGTSPPLLVGREQAVLAFGDALDAGAGAPGRATLYVGARGVGKTVMLNEVEAQAKERGWVVVSETASRGLLHRLVRESLPRAAEQLELTDDQRRISGLTLPMQLGGIDFEIEPGPRPEAGLRTQLDTLTRHLADRSTGLLITVDEIHAAAREDLRALGATIQHSFREEQPLAFAAAGLPSTVNDLLTDDVLTFLRRAERQTLGIVDPADVADALQTPIRDADRLIDDGALAEAVSGTGGYPFLIQLIGYWIWRSEPTTETISVAQVRLGMEAARLRMGSLIHEPALFDLSTTDRSFLAAMARDDGPSRMAEIADRLRTNANYASQYRLRLIAAGMIRPTGRGYVDFALPYLREHLRAHAAELGIDIDDTEPRG